MQCSCVGSQQQTLWAMLHVVFQVVKLGGATPTFTVYPMPGARHVQVPIYATEASTASHVTEAGMQSMGVIEARPDGPS